ncbi:MAG: putative sulfate exporter family transporter, partial [Dehalococcoidia bacterium]|nr:putative sulfate exporter family transporter [Dehalococcoidia bacterium]
TIDTTGAVVAAGTLVDPDTGLQSAALVKMAQNVLIGLAAFLLAIWASFSPENRAASERPRPIEIWYRLPKFIIGFVLASVLFSVVVEPTLGSKTTSAVLGLTKGYREWFFALAFVSIGLETRFRELVAVGRGKPAVAFLVGQAFNLAWALLVVWLLWSGVLFKPPV